MCVQPPTVSKMLDRMESTGLVRRTADTEDSRVSRVYLTEQGRDNLQGLREVWICLEQRMTKNLTTEEQLLLRRLLLHMYQNLGRDA
jgi:DNA-binding MarR family transcriptional regulator